MATTDKPELTAIVSPGGHQVFVNHSTGITQEQEAAMMVAFFAPADMRGKWHAKRIVTGEADCGAGTILGHERIDATKHQLQTKTMHRIICGRCAFLHRPGRTSEGVVR